MSITPRWKVALGEAPITLMGAPKGTVEVGGVDVSERVIEVGIYTRAGGPAQLELRVGLVEATAFGDTEPTWVGLEQIPSDALRAELQKRIGEER